MNLKRSLLVEITYSCICMNYDARPSPKLLRAGLLRVHAARLLRAHGALRALAFALPVAGAPTMLTRVHSGGEMRTETDVVTPPFAIGHQLQQL